MPSPKFYFPTGRTLLVVCVLFLFSTQVFSQAVISSFTPASGPVGTTVTISGANFDATFSNNTIYFGGLAVAPTSGNATTLTFDIPAGAATVSPIIVLNGITGLQTNSLHTVASGERQFVVTASPTYSPYYSSVSTQLLTVTYPQKILSADFNGDGNADIVTANTFDSQDGHLSVALGTGAGTFESFNDYVLTNATDITSLALGDFNGDGIFDIAASDLNPGNQIEIMYGAGDGTFTSGSTIDLTSAAVNAANMDVADFDNNGYVDLVFSTIDAEAVVVLLNNGDDTFSSAALHAVTGEALDVVTGDFNNDGNADIVSANQTSNGIHILLGDGVGGFSGATFFDVSSGTPQELVTGDFDNDGNLDILTRNFASVSLFRGQGDGSFVRNNTSVTLFQQALSVGDFNGDGILDIAMANSTNDEVEVYLGNGIASFSLSTTVVSGTDIASLTTADFNLDGKADIVALDRTEEKVYVHLWSPRPLAVVAATPFINETNIIASDDIIINFDAVLDGTTLNATNIQVMGSKSGLHSAVYSGGGTTSLTINPDTDFFAGEKVAVTITDGVLGVSLESAVPYTLSFTIETGPFEGAFIKQSTALEGVVDGAASWADFDGNGYIDVVVSGWDFGYGAAITKVFSNSGAAFEDIGASLSAAYEGSTDWGDYDNDGDLDLFLTGFGDVEGFPIAILYNNNAGTFEVAGGPFQGVYFSEADWGDFDNDGDLDLVVQGQIQVTPNVSTTTIYRNDAGTFTDHSAGLTGVRTGGVAWGDYDNDGDLDLVSSGYTTGNASEITTIYRNDNGVFTDIVAGLQGKSYGKVAWGDYDNDGDLDLIVSGSGVDNAPIIYRNDAGSFVDSNAGLLENAEGEFAWGDYDGDGDLDLVINGSGETNDPTTTIYINNSGTYVNSGIKVDNYLYSTADWGDYDNDGDLDLLMTGTDDFNGGRVALYKNTVAPPMIYNATNVTTAGFTPNLIAPSGAVDLIVDVSTDPAFGSFLPSGQNISVGISGVVDIGVTLVAGTQYFYRAKTDFGGGIESTYYVSNGFMVKQGNALPFTVDDYVEVFDNPLLEPAGDFTIEFWFRTTSFGNERVFIEKGTADAEYSVRQLIGGEIGLNVNGGNMQTIGTYSDASWHHVAVVYRGNNDGAIYVDGIDDTDVGSIALGTPAYSFGRLNIGDRRFGGSFNIEGSIDEIRIWDDERTLSEINQYKYASLIGSEAGLLAYYRFDETTGLVLPDLSGNGLNGSLTNMVGNEWTTSGVPDPPAPAAPTDLIAYKSTGTEITLEWTDNSIDELAYKVERADDFGFTVNVVEVENTLAVDANSYVFNAGANQGYFFRVTPINGFENAGSESQVEFGTTTAFPGFALNLDGVDDQVIINHQPDLNFVENDFTLEAWVFLTANINETILSKGNGNGGGNPDVLILQVQPDRSLGLEMANSSLTSEWHFSDPGAVPLSSWAHVAVSFNSTTRDVAFFVNGVAAGTANYSIVPSSHGDTNPLFIGKQGFGCNCNFFDGRVDEVKIWNYEKTDFSDRLSRPQGDEPNLIAYYPMDENLGTKLVDRSAKVNNGDLVNGPTFIKSSVGQRPFITTWVTTDGTITVPTTGSGYNYDITWANLTTAFQGDGLITGQTGDYQITGLTNGDTYQIEITGDFPRIYFNNGSEGQEVLKIQSIEQWGDIVWSSMERAFWGCSNLTSGAIDAPDLTNVTNMAIMFGSASSFNGDVTNWDVSNVTNMFVAFEFATSFNQNLSNWDVSSVTSMTGMFSGASSFNNGDAAGVSATPLNWTMGAGVTLSMDNMFKDATSFNQDLSSWDVSGVADMFFMFNNAASFNQDLSLWNVASVTSMANMFTDASSFNQSLGAWDISNVTAMNGMLDNSGLSVANYDNTLIGWAALPIANIIDLGASGLIYCSAASARASLISGYTWTFTGDSQNCPPTIDTNTGIALNEGANHIIQLSELSGSDPDVPAATTLVYNLISSPVFGSVQLSGSATTSFSQQNLINGTVSYQHDGSENFIDGFAFTLTDGSNTTTTVSVNITIVPVNDLPTFTFFTNAITTALEDTEVQTTLAQLLAQGNETDVDGTVMGFKVTAVTSGSLKIGASAGIATPFVATTNDVIDATNNAYWTPEGNVNGPGIGAMELLAVDDGGGVSATAGVIASVNVTAVNDAPVFVEQSFTTVENDAAFEAQLVFSDVDSDPLSFFIASGNTGGTFAVDPSTGLITVAQVVGLDYETTPEFQLNVGVTDAVDSVVAIITIQLTDEPEAPVALAGSNVTTFGFTAYWNQLSGVDGYRLEVATDALFTTRLTGFDPKEQTDTTVIVTGLYHASSYYYRLKAFAGTAETAYSNTIEVKTLHSAELTSDSTALVKIYDEMGGAGWTNSANWKAAQLRGWSGVVVENSRVTAVNLASNNVTGAFPTLTGTELNALIQLDLANNQITTVPANANLAALQVLDLSSNQLDFGSLEQFAGVTTFSYSPQADLFTAVDLLQERGEPLSIDRTSAGASNQYQWYKNGTAIDGATGPVYTIAFPTFAEEGSYTAQVSNTQLPNLTLTTLPITLRVSSLERDRLILTELYNLTGGDSWNNNTNWNTADIASWFGITVANDRVTGITLPSNNLVGELPLRLGDMRRLTAIDISNNEVSSLPALTNIIELTTFNVSNNRLQFDDLEPNVGIASINYAPQKLTGQARDEKIAVNTAVTVEVPVGGTANSYQWYRNGSPIAAGTSSTYQLGPIRYENMGSYELEITSSKVAGLTLRSEVQRVLGTAMITGSIIDLNNASVANANGALLGVKTGAYDTTGFYTSSDNGVLTINDVVLGDYLLYGEQDKQVYIPSYYRSTIDWVFADLIQLRDNIGDLVLTMVNVPRELTPADGDNTFKGLFESDFGDTGGKVLDRSRVQGAGVSVSRSRFRAKDNEDDYELIAYVQTDETGQFEMNNLPDGDYRVNIQYPGIPMDPTSFIDFQLGGGSGVEQNSIRINALATPTKIVVTKVEETGIYLDYFKGLVVYPNPADDYITIRYEKLVKGNVFAELTDLTGRAIMSKEVRPGTNQQTVFDLTDVKNGLYILRFFDKHRNGIEIASFRLILKK
ncbi:MAG: FG-GAP-like repeat-containing protein [Imperialibacter sp.]|uniref:FG-GAP-like repeat-containing protein n=1 Tax=Imperialibacter sp. TaxID=2038411 RepID=UPI003A8AB7E9